VRGVRPALLWSLLVIALLGAWAGPAGAQAPTSEPEPEAAPEPEEAEEADTGVQGTLSVTIDGERVKIEGVTITVTTPDGEEVGEAVTGDDGRWFVAVPGAGTYEVTIDESTLPDDAQLREGEPTTRTAEVEDGRVRGVIFKLGERAGSTTSEGARAVNQFVDGLKLGLIIALAAVGLSLIFGVTGLINFAHGELVTLGALVVWFLNTGDGPAWPLGLATVVAVGVGAAAGFGLESTVFRPLRRRRTGNVALIVVTIGMGLALRNIYLIVFGGNAKPFRQYALQEQWEIGPLTIAPRDLWIMGIATVVMVAVALMLQRTRLGTAMRAVADNPELAEASGIDTSRVILTTWITGAALAALGGVMLGLTERVSVDMGERILLLMFAAVVVGGLGRAYGALVGALLIGITVQMSTLWISVEFKYVAAFGLLILVLLVRPQGILGSPERVG
jgi:branched-chain amino acid transport system permease protein